MGIMAVERMKVKNPYQGLMNELLEEYGLSPIEAKALVKRVAQFKEEQQSGARDNGQIVKKVVAFGELAGKRIIDCKLVPVNLTMYFNGEEKLEKDIVVPTRAQIEDIGPGITHKEKIIELLIKGYRYSEIMIQTVYTEASIENYEKNLLE
ncbi:DUF1670 domain-containing protein [Clostridium tagluense]|uniref:Uncharacterized protein n=1 Tax=Clostridium tagluense TaxID=360422 RepID=A0A401UGW4_9CLOT|nr:DUF1670 domain-containing protein [Clostridium tagluense]GCD08729.1 hypothetical protein Ctaglu_03520 [Clostridium tagluense]